MGLEVRENSNRRRFELWEDGELAGFADFVVVDGVVAVPHTEVEPARTGRGLAGELVRALLDTARSRGQQVLPQCPYVSAWIRRHPEYVDLVPRERRRAYGLPEA